MASIIPVPMAELHVENAQLPGARVSPDSSLEAFGGGPHLAAQATIITEMQATAKKQADEIAVMEADRKLSEFENQVLYDPKSGALNRMGKDAFGAPQQVSESFKETSDKIAGSLANDEQKIAFQKFRNQRAYDLDKQVQRHVSVEMRKFDDEATNAYVSNEREAASLNYTDPDRIDMAIARQAGAIQAFGKRNGMPAEWVAQKVKATTGATYALVVDRMLANQQDVLAKTYFDDHQKEIDAKDTLRLEKELKVGNMRGESQRQSDTILATTKDLGSALKEARAIKDPAIRDATEERVNKFYVEQQHILKQQQDKTFLEATNVIEKSRDVRAIPPAQWLSMSLEQRNALESRAKHLTSGTEPTLNMDKWMQFLDLRPAELAKIDPATLRSTYQPYMDKMHWEHAMGQWAQARDAASKPGAAAVLSAMQSDSDTVRNAFSQTVGKADRKDWSKDEEIAYTRFNDSSAAAVQRFELDNKRKATDEEKQKIVRGILVDKVFANNGWIYNSEKPAILLSDDERKSAYVPLIKIPATAQERMLNLARSWNVVDSGMSNESAKRLLQKRLERAYGASLTGASDEQIKSILTGK